MPNNEVIGVQKQEGKILETMQSDDLTNLLPQTTDQDCMKVQGRISQSWHHTVWSRKVRAKDIVLNLENTILWMVQGNPYWKKN